MMDCYKEEAIRVKADAESKMQSKDFIAARKIALNAQRIYKDLENISQILTVCNVHCAAEKKLLGNETDWYGILQIEETADEALIKKQYRKFALQLHPDKNRYPGAEAAFKLIGEAQRVLLDKGKRSLHDIKHKTSQSGKFPQHKRSQKATYPANCGVQNNPGGNFTGVKYQQQQTQQGVPRSASPSSCATFWTACPFCNIKYQYCLDVINKLLLCQFCRKTFVAYEKSWHGATTLNLNQATSTQRKDALHRVARKVELSNQRVVNGEHLKTAFSQKRGCDTEFCSGKENGKKLRKKDLESSESSDTTDEDDMLIDDGGDFKAKVNFACHGEGPRRSHRRKQQVSYNENVSDDEKCGSSPKKTKGSGSSCATNKQKANGLMGDGSEANKQSSQDGNQKDENKAKEVDPSNVEHEEQVEENAWKESSETHIGSALDPNSPPTSEPETFAYDEPDFNDFDKLRDEYCFSEGQVWALYDTVDAMPRFYALIRKVFSSVFKLRITWLEPVPDDKVEVEWFNEELSISCGQYKHGNSETIDQRLMFSHVVPCGKNKPNDPYKIYPRQGETWALFKNWDIKWKLDADTRRKYDYEFVEILSDFNEDVGVCVAYLHKLKGFVGVFCRVGEESFQIPSAELLRFSHMIPSFKLAGKEKECVPKGSFELDPASLPKNIEEINIPVDIGKFAGSDHMYSSSKSSFDEVKKSEEEFVANYFAHETESADLKEAYLGSVINNSIEIPEAEFFDFDAHKSIEKFKVGQIWALYSNEDRLPKYYAQIVKIDSTKGCKLDVMWLASCPSKHILRWYDKNMLVNCGRFHIQKDSLESFTSTKHFSHLLTAESVNNKDEYDILPKKGEVWALYRDWSLEMQLSNLDKCEYELVEVLEVKDKGIKVLRLERVNGFNWVFKRETGDQSTVSMVIVYAELLRFSHQIPAFRLTRERDGTLRNFWKLDPAALPLHYFARQSPSSWSIFDMFNKPENCSKKLVC